MLGIRQMDEHITNTELYKRANQLPTGKIIRQRRLSFIGHCLRMDKNEPAHIYALYIPEIKDKGRKGAPRTTYKETVIRDIQDYTTVNKKIPRRIRSEMNPDDVHNMEIRLQKMRDRVERPKNWQEREEELDIIIQIAKNKKLWKEIVELHTRGPDQ